MRWTVAVLILVAVSLGGCGRGSDVGRAPTAGPAAQTEVVRGEKLPGRLLFVRDGVIWRWLGNEGRPLLGAGEAVQPAWSPEGRRIAYIARSNSFSDLLLADADGAPIGRVTANGTDAPPNSIERVYASRWVFYPAWTPEGSSLVVASQPQPPSGDPPADYNLALALQSTAPGEPLPLYADVEAMAGRSAVSPDGTAVVFTRAGVGPQGRQELYRIDLLGGEATPLPGAPAPSYDPAFSPDGRWLAFAARAGGGTDVYVMEAGGATARRLTELESARAPAFSPDGTLLAFLAVAPGESGFDLWVVELTAGEGGELTAGTPRRVTTGLGLDADSGLSWAE
jgi:TolB protein